MIGDIFFSMGDVGRRYMDVSPLSATPASLSFFQFLLWGSPILSKVAVF